MCFPCLLQAGATSCSYEGETASLFYKNSGYDSTLVGEGGETVMGILNIEYQRI